LAISDISNLASPVKISQLLLPGKIITAVVEGVYSYLTNLSCLFVVDVSSPKYSEVVGYLEIGDYAHGVAVEGDYAYVAGGLRGLFMVM